MMITAPRYAPEIPFPPYSYVSGQWPHPLRDPAGHSYGTTHAPLVLPEQTAWRSCREYCYAVDLWNAGYYWEAHEQWEALWHAAGRKGTAADLFKGLIKLAAAGVKVREGRRAGVERHLDRANQLFCEVFVLVSRELRETTYWGLNLASLRCAIKEIQSSLPAMNWEQATSRQPVLRVWDARLALA